jgi:ribose transport system substrate-binding protein
MIHDGFRRIRGAAGSHCLMVTILLMTGLICPGTAQEGPPGITRPVTFPTFDPNAPACSRPSGLRKALTFAQDNGRKFMQGVARGLKLAARDRGLAFEIDQANNDPALMTEQVRKFVSSNGGALVISPVDSQSISAAIKQAIWSGAYVGAIVPPPAISVLNAPQYLTGKVLGDEAASYIKAHLKGKAKVVLLTHDQLQFLAPRFAAIRNSLKDIPGVTIVADISPLTVDEAGGAATMRTILLAAPRRHRKIR